MKAGYQQLDVQAQERDLNVQFVLRNNSGGPWKQGDVFIGWQLFDPETGRFIREGEWSEIPGEIGPGQSAPIHIALNFPPEPGGYRIYISPLEPAVGWAYDRGARFILIDAEVSREMLVVHSAQFTTMRTLKRRALRKAIPKVFQLPFATIARNRSLIRSMARRDILARYRGSSGDVLWTVLNPLLLMATYFFVFGVVLHTRFGADNSSSGYVLYFLAGMLPWLGFSEPVGRAPQVVLEHRNFVKKLIFPLEILPVNQVASGFISELFALGIFLLALLLIRHSIPVTALWFPVLVIPQLMFTLGFCWFLAGLGAYLRDLGQIMGLVLTLWMYVTPIFYPETSLPKQALFVLGKNPLFTLVHGYRRIFLEHAPPELGPTLKLWIVALVAFLLGHAWFYKLRKTFADVI